MKHFNYCELSLVAFPAFGMGVLFNMFLPPTVLVGTCAALAVGVGIICITSKC